MNIFYLDTNPTIAAQYHVDRHVVKMILESAQMLSTVHHLNTSDKRILDNIYRPTHYHHPSTIWASQNKNNYRWLYLLFIALLDEYTFRFGKIHKSSVLIDFLKEPPESLSDGALFPPTPAMEDRYLVNGDSLLSYRNYYLLAKNHLFHWTKRSRPEWLNK